MQKPISWRSGLAFFAVAGLVAGCAPTQNPVAVENPRHQQSSSSASLGTQWGEGLTSDVVTVDLRRLSSQPVDQVEIRYSATNYRGREVQEAMIANGRIGFYVLGDNNRKWPFTMDGRQLYLQGQDGERYQLCYQNYAQSIYEIVATVDGLDVLTGKQGSINLRGYVLYPNSSLCIEGFRKNANEVAAFRFSSPQDAYAANTASGDMRNVGVIGTAVFELNNNPQTINPSARGGSQTTPQAFPADASGNGSYAPPPRYSY